MQYIWDHIQDIEEKIKQHKTLLLMLDFDGTLSPMATHPDKAFLPNKTKEILETLHKKPHVILAIISGRSVNNLKEKVGIQGIIYAGNHGMEEEVFGHYVRLDLSDDVKNALAVAKKELTELQSQYPQSTVEDKGIILGFHYRLLDPSLVDSAKNDFYEIAKHFKNILKVFYGTYVLELRPKTDINKGTFVLSLIKRVAEKIHQHPFPMYIGDEATDEDVFTSLPDGLTIIVGNTQGSKAAYSLSNTEDVLRFLTWINQMGERE